MLFECWEKTGKSYADRVKARNKLVTSENALRIRQEAMQGRQSHGFRDQLHARAHLRRSRSVTHHSRKLSRDVL
jgi:hypothetical protein